MAKFGKKSFGTNYAASRHLLKKTATKILKFSLHRILPQKSFFLKEKARLLPCPAIMFRTQDLFCLAVCKAFDKLDLGSS